MLIKYGLFDSTQDDGRTYVADEVAVIFRALALSGVKNLTDCLKVTAAGDGMKVNMAPGSAMVNGYLMDAIDDGAGVYQLTLNAGGSQPRIDRIVIRLDLSSTARTVLPAVKLGMPAGTPAAPTLTRSGEVYEISLAQIYVAAGATTITAANVTDERSDESVCGAIVPEVFKLSTLGKTHVHDAATTGQNGFISSAQIGQLNTATSTNAAQDTRLASLESRVAGLETRMAAAEAALLAHGNQLAGLTPTSTPSFKGANFTGSINANGNYIDNALFR